MRRQTRKTVSAPEKPLPAKGVSFWIPGDVLLALNAFAKKRNRSRAYLIREALTAHLHNVLGLTCTESELPATRAFGHGRALKNDETPHQARKICVRLSTVLRQKLAVASQKLKKTSKQIVRDALRVWLRKNGCEPLPKRKPVSPHYDRIIAVKLVAPGKLLAAAAHVAERSDISVAECIRRAIASYIKDICKIYVTHKDTALLQKPRRHTPKAFDESRPCTYTFQMPRTLHAKLRAAVKKHKTVFNVLIARALEYTCAR